MVRFDPKLAITGAVGLVAGLAAALGAVSLLGPKADQATSRSPGVAPPAPTVTQPTGRWLVEVDTSALDGAKEATARLMALNDVRNMIGNPQRPAVQFGCRRGIIYTMIIWPEWVDDGSHFRDLRWRLDDGPVQTTTMHVEGQAIGLGRQQAIDWIQTLASARRLIVEVPDRRAGQEATFDLTGIKAVAPLFAAGTCPRPS